VDVASDRRNPDCQQGFKAAPNAARQVGGRSVDIETEGRRLARKQKESISRNFVKPSDGLEPSTPSLPSSNEAGTAGKAGKPRARKSRKKKESPEDE